MRDAQKWFWPSTTSPRWGLPALFAFRCFGRPLHPASKACLPPAAARAQACDKAARWMPGETGQCMLQVMMDFLREWEEKLQIKITCSQVRQPRGNVCVV